jgi:hypothetical protein
MKRIARASAWLLVAPCLLLSGVTVVRAATSQAKLTWTAPGDDSLAGRATSYDVRYSLSPITATNFTLATRVTGVPAPKPSGSAETLTVTNLIAGTSYYFAIKTGDEVTNWSALSNIVSSTFPTARVGVSPLVVSFSSSWPNPARESTHWSYALPREGAIEVVAFDLGGRHVRNIARGWRGAGSGELAWDLRDDGGRPVAPGLYLIRANLGGETMVRRVVVAQ